MYLSTFIGVMSPCFALFKRGDYITVALLLSVTLILSLPRDMGVIGQRFRVISPHIEEERVLDEYGQWGYKGPLGNTYVECSPEGVRIVESPCMGQICVSTGWLRHSDQVTACLPNRIAITILGDNTDFDAVIK